MITNVNQQVVPESELNIGHSDQHWPIHKPDFKSVTVNNYYEFHLIVMSAYKEHLF